MNNHDFYVHVIGVALLIGSGLLSLGLEDRRLKHWVSSFFVLVLSLLLADVVLHLLPNAIAGFIYGSRYHSIPVNLLKGH
ncbi:MAG: hypothetical protein LUQ11_06565 [Methylococcaceae bacterium]|nr:hypothetical protein [Methylococcaceae bacterium]